MEKYIRKKFIFWLVITLILIYFEFFLTFTVRLSSKPNFYFLQERFIGGADDVPLSFIPAGVKMPEESIWAFYTYEIRGRKEIKDGVTNIYLEGVYKKIKPNLISRYLLGLGDFGPSIRHIIFDIKGVKEGAFINIHSIDGIIDTYFLKRDQNGTLRSDPTSGSFTRFCFDLIECIKQRNKNFDF